MGTKTEPGKYDCYDKALPDEPIFTLKAGDPLAPGTVRRWAKRYRKEHWDKGTGDPDKFTEAMQVARDMEKWRKNNIDET